MINKTITTIPLTLLFATLDKPDTKFKQEGQFTVKLRLDPHDEKQAALIATLSAFELDCYAHEEAELQKRIAEGGKDAGKLKVLAKSLAAADSKVAPEFDKEGNETGMFTLNVARTASGKKKDGSVWKIESIPVFDASSPPQLIKNVASLQIGRGSVVCVKMELSSYLSEGLKKAGMTAKLLGVQVRKLVKYGGGGATADDFEGGGEGDFASSPGSEDFVAGSEGSDDDIPL